MIGVILSGHGRFAEGMLSSLEMIAGKSEAVEAINFLESDSTDDLEKKMLNVIQDYNIKYDGVLVCCDLLGGSPFKTAATLSVQEPNVSVVAGINLASCLELLFMRMNSTDAGALADALINADANRLLKFTLPTKKEEVESEDGI
jgi:PTS system N-acetylgalactosamine-specific IIA component